MGRAINRYILKHYRKITIKREIYERIRKIAEEEQISVPEAVRLLVDTYEKVVKGELGPRQG